MLRVKGKGRSMILRTQTGTKSTAMRLPGIKWASEQEGWGRGATGRLFRKSRVWAEGKGIISLFWGSGFFLHHVIIFDFKFGSNHTASSEDTIIFVAAHGPHRTIPLLVVSDFRVSYVTQSMRGPAAKVGQPPPQIPPQRKKNRSSKQKKTPGKHYPTSRPGDGPPPASPL